MLFHWTVLEAVPYARDPYLVVREAVAHDEAVPAISNHHLAQATFDGGAHFGKIAERCKASLETINRALGATDALFA